MTAVDIVALEIAAKTEADSTAASSERIPATGFATLSSSGSGSLARSAAAMGKLDSGGSGSRGGAAASAGCAMAAVDSGSNALGQGPSVLTVPSSPYLTGSLQAAAAAAPVGAATAAPRGGVQLSELPEEGAGVGDMRPSTRSRFELRQSGNSGAASPAAASPRAREPHDGVLGRMELPWNSEAAAARRQARLQRRSALQREADLLAAGSVPTDAAAAGAGAASGGEPRAGAAAGCARGAAEEVGAQRQHTMETWLVTVSNQPWPRRGWGGATC